MAVFNVNQADNYGGQGGSGYFSLKNDRDTAKVRFLYRDVEDVTGYAVHEVSINDKKRYVNCLRDYGEPMDNCPFCKNGKFTQVKYFVPLFNEDSGKTVIWERGKKFGTKLTSLCARYPNLVSHQFEIERNGKAGDTATTYEIYEVSNDNAKLEDFEQPRIMGSMVLDKSYDELRHYIEYGSFPSDEDNAPIQRRGERPESDDRRTPNTRRNAF